MWRLFARLLAAVMIRTFSCVTVSSVADASSLSSWAASAVFEEPGKPSPPFPDAHWAKLKELLVRPRIATVVLVCCCCWALFLNDFLC